MSQTAKVTINEAPPVAAKPDKITTTCADGRVLTVEEPDVLAPFRLVEIIGASAAENSTYINMVFPLLYLKEINGEKVFPPATKLQLEALIQQLGHDGVKKLRNVVQENFASEDQKAEKAAVKN